jgi:hypothetical protein
LTDRHHPALPPDPLKIPDRQPGYVITDANGNQAQPSVHSIRTLSFTQQHTEVAPSVDKTDYVNYELFGLLCLLLISVSLNILQRRRYNEQYNARWAEWEHRTSARSVLNAIRNSQEIAGAAQRSPRSSIRPRAVEHHVAQGEHAFIPRGARSERRSRTVHEAESPFHPEDSAASDYSRYLQSPAARDEGEGD